MQQSLSYGNWSYQNTQLESLWALKRISKQVSHDIRSPLGALKVAAQSLASRPEVSLRVIDRATTRIEAIIAELELVEDTPNRPTPGQLLNVNLFLAELIEEKFMEFENLDRGLVNIEYSCPQEPIINLIEPNKLARAISNIINNGVEAATTRPATIKINVARNGSNTVIEILDTGKGLPEELQAKATRRGFSHGKKGGRGLGLSYAKNVIEEHGGSLEIDWNHPEGTNVRLTIC